MTDLEVQAMVALDAIEAEDPRAETLLIPIRARMIAHGEREGRKDYEGRAKDVAAGSAEPQWAWAGIFLNADDAYLDAVGSGAIMREIGLPERMWEHVSDTWLRAFKRGYVAAHKAATTSVRKKKSSAQLDREIAEVLGGPRRRRSRT
jgi:hypothetical protein